MTTTEAIENLLSAAIVVRKCRLTPKQMEMAEAILKIAISMRPTDNDVLQVILIEIEEMGPSIDGDTAIEYLSNLRADLLLHLGDALTLPNPKSTMFTEG